MDTCVRATDPNRVVDRKAPRLVLRSRALLWFSAPRIEERMGPRELADTCPRPWSRYPEGPWAARVPGTRCSQSSNGHKGTRGKGQGRGAACYSSRPCILFSLPLPSSPLSLPSLPPAPSLSPCLSSLRRAAPAVPTFTPRQTNPSSPPAPPCWSLLPFAASVAH